jgi:hypothetical protein
MNYRIVRVNIESVSGICEQCGNLGELLPFGLINDMVCNSCYEKNGEVSKLKEKQFIDGCVAMDERVHGGFTLH